MSLPPGVTCIVGGAFHGKTTLLSSIRAGVHNKIQGNGNLCVVTTATATGIRAEDGRKVVNADLSPFFSSLPPSCQIEPEAFSTSDASGSTSQAANIVEAIEVSLWGGGCA